jgi:3-oxoacyl-[acyl-carrier-protein] synthase III
MRLDNMYLAGIGVFLPTIVSTGEAIARGRFDADLAASSGWLSVADGGDIAAPDMAISAARQALARSGHQPADFALLVHACGLHQGPDAWPAPSYVQANTIGGDAPAIELRQSCCGMLAGLELSCCFLESNRASAAMVTGADNFGTPLFDRYHYGIGAGTNRASIVGDAGSAVVLSRSHGFARLLAISSMSVPPLEKIYRSGVALFPPEPTIGRPADIGARIAHYREQDPHAMQAAKDALDRARTVLGTRTLAEAGVDAAQVTRATHVFSGGTAYIESVLAPLGIDVSKGMLELGRGLGHLGTCDQVVGLDHLLMTGQVDIGDHVLMLGNGGASLSCAVVEIVERPSWVPAQAA